MPNLPAPLPLRRLYSSIDNPLLRQQTLRCIGEHLRTEGGQPPRRPNRRHTMDIVLRSMSVPLLSAFANFTLFARNALGGNGPGIRALKTSFERWSVLSSPHVHKTAFTQFERRTHERVVMVGGLEGELRRRLIWYLKRNAPPDISMEFRLHDHIPIDKILSGEALQEYLEQNKYEVSDPSEPGSADVNR